MLCRVGEYQCSSGHVCFIITQRCTSKLPSLQGTEENIIAGICISATFVFSWQVILNYKKNNNNHNCIKSFKIV